MLTKVEICGVNTSELPVIKDNELKAYFKRINAGDLTAREEFIRGNLRLVLSVIQSFASRGNIEDLFQVGCIGLIKAVDRFDISYDLKFSTYAVPMIIGELKRYLRDSSSMRVSRSLRDTAYHAFLARQELMKNSNSEPTIEEVAKKMDMDVSDVAYAISAVQEPVSIYEPVYQEDGDSLNIIDALSDETSTDESWLNSITLKDSISRLPKREKNILRLRFFEGKTQIEVAEEIGISQAQVSRIERSALNTLKSDM